MPAETTTKEKEPEAAKRSPGGWFRLSVVDDPADSIDAKGQPLTVKKRDGTERAIKVRAPRDSYSIFGRTFQRETYNVFPEETDDQGFTKRVPQRGAVVELDPGEADRIKAEIPRRFVEWVNKADNRSRIHTIARRRVPDPGSEKGWRIMEVSEQTPRSNWKSLSAYLRIEYLPNGKPE